MHKNETFQNDSGKFFTRGPGTRMVTFVLFTCFNYHWSQEGQLCDMKVKSTCSCAFPRSFYESLDQPGFVFYNVHFNNLEKQNRF